MIGRPRGPADRLFATTLVAALPAPDAVFPGYVDQHLLVEIQRGPLSREALVVIHRSNGYIAKSNG
jgi:hypothetical protein